MPVALAALFPLLAVLVGCTELPLQELPTIVLDGIPIYSRADQVPKPELRAAIALDRSLMSGAAGKAGGFNQRNSNRPRIWCIDCYQTGPRGDSYGVPTRTKRL